MKKHTLLLIVFSFLLISCAGNKKGGENAQAPLQREVFGVTLGETYTYDDLVDILAQSIEGLQRENEGDLWDTNPELSIAQQDQFVSYYVFSEPNAEGYLFENHNWNTVRLDATEDGRIFAICFASTSTDKAFMEQQQTMLLTNLTEKYGEPSIAKSDYTSKDNNWFDGTYAIRLSFTRFGDYYGINLTFKENATFSEIYGPEEEVGKEEK